MTRHGLWIVWWMVAVAPCWAQPKASPPEVSSAEQLAAESLLHSARTLYHAPTETARAGRLVAIAQCIARLCPTDLRAQRLLYDIYQSRGRLTDAVAAARRQFDADPQDHAAGVRWLRTRLGTLDRADERAAFLKALLETPALPEALRSVAATEVARIFVAQGADSQAQELLDQAIDLDPLNDTALISRLELTDTPDVVLRVETMIALLRSNPRAWWVARQLAALLGELGLHDQALAMHRQAWGIWQGARPLGEATADFAVEYCSALLDAGQAEAAIQLFAPEAKRLKDSGEFQSLLVEAYRTVGQNDKAEPLLKHLERLYNDTLTAEAAKSRNDPNNLAQRRVAAARAVNLGWFYLLTRGQPLSARQYARQAEPFGAKGDAIELLLGASELALGQAGGAERIEPLVETYPLAAALLADYHYAKTDTKQPNLQAGRKALLAGLAGPRKDLAWRKLAALAKQQNVEIPPVSGAAAADKRLTGYTADMRRMGVQPETFLQARIRPVKDVVPLAEAIEIEATLTNRGSLPIPIGPRGLVSHRMGLAVVVNERPSLRFMSLPVAIWPAPRFLAPGRSLTCRVRLDVGALDTYLANHPLEQLTLAVEGVVSPQEGPEGIVSGLPTVPAPRAQLRRLGLLGEWNGVPPVSPQDFSRQVRSVETTLAEGAVPQRMRAVRIVAGLLGWIREVENGAIAMPESLRAEADKKVLLGLMARAEDDPSPVVRAELLAALGHAHLGPEILNQLGLLIEDPSALVRFRMAELIGSSGTKGREAMVAKYAADSDPLVRRMARAFAEPETTTTKPE